MSVRVLALDLERTLIDNSLRAFGKNDGNRIFSWVLTHFFRTLLAHGLGLLAFLAFCQERFGRIAVFTTVEEADAREVLEALGRAGHLPEGLLGRLEYVGWSGAYKDLAFIPDAAPGEVLLIDDDAGWVRPDQRNRWVPIAAWDGGADGELSRIQSVLEGWLARGAE